jgi:hypothetical protein
MSIKLPSKLKIAILKIYTKYKCFADIMNFAEANECEN